MKKTILVATLALLGVGSATASDDFNLFADKKQKREHKNEKAVEVKPVSVASSNTVQERNLEKVLAERNSAPKIETPKAEKAPSDAWASKYTNTYPNSLHLFKDNGTGSSKIRVYTNNTISSTDVNDGTFYKIVSNIESIQASKKANTERSQLKLKSLDYQIHELAKNGNVNSIDYLCINPKKSPYIQVDVMKHYCDIAAANNHVEFFGYRAWIDDPSHVKVSNSHSNRKQHDHLLMRSLKGGASWALLLEAQNAPNENIRQKVIYELSAKKSSHWLHAGALQVLSDTPHELGHTH